MDPIVVQGALPIPQGLGLFGIIAFADIRRIAEKSLFEK
jgi:hypothetical protein